MARRRNSPPFRRPRPPRSGSKRWLPELWPLPQFEATQAGNTLRVFERGDDRLSNRGFGTLTRTDPVFLGLQRTRLLDPLLYFLGTNDQPGDYRSSRVHRLPRGLRERSRSPRTPAPTPQHGHLGYSATADPTIPKNEEGHPIQHRLTRPSPPASAWSATCIPGTSYASQYFGYTWWDNETDGERMYPAKSKNPEAEQTPPCRCCAIPKLPSLEGNWSDPEFLRNVARA